MQKQDVFVQRLKSYDTSLDYHIEIYDHLPYVRERDLCGEENIERYSNNVVKSVQCVVMKPIIINNHDDEFLPRLEQMRKEQEEALVIGDTDVLATEALSDSQWDSLSSEPPEAVTYDDEVYQEDEDLDYTEDLPTTA